MMTKSEKITGIVLAVILLITVINSTWYFLGIARVSFIQWIVFNACAPSSLAYLLGVLLYVRYKNKCYLAIAIVPLLFFGTMGLFVFPWQTANDVLIQFSHVIMTLNIFWALWIILKDKDYKALAIGLLISVFVFIPFIAFTQQYCRIYADDVMKLLGL